MCVYYHRHGIAADFADVFKPLSVLDLCILLLFHNFSQHVVGEVAAVQSMQSYTWLLVAYTRAYRLATIVLLQ